MGLFRTLCRAAFLCNICFLLAIGLLYYKHPVDPGISSLLLVTGFFLSVLLNLCVNIALFIFWKRRKPIFEVPRFLIYVNAGCMLIQLILLLL